MPFTSLLLGLNPDFDKRRILSDNSFYDKEDYYVSSSIGISLKNAFFLDKEIKENENCLINAIKEISFLEDNWNNYNTPKISSKTIINSLKVINALPPSILNYLTPDNIYPSKTGTIIMDWEIDNENILSLEVAKKSVGYFVEVNGEDYKQVEKIEIENLQQIVSSINNDLSILI